MTVPRGLVPVVVSWHLAMIALGVAGVLERTVGGLHLPIILVYAVPLTAFLVWRRTSAAASWLDAVDMRVLMALHSMRWIGIGTTFLAAYHLTSPRWAISVGLGDTVAAVGLTYLAIVGFQRGRLGRGAVRFWNLLGLIDFTHALVLVMLMLPSPIAFLAGAGPEHDASIAVTFPFVIVPIVVPFFVCTHLTILHQLRRRSAEIQF